jgi:hypothetical protein
MGVVYQPEMPGYAIEFFALFARLEYALKAEGMWIKAGSNVSVDWSALETKKELLDLIDALEADKTARYLLLHPPKKQRIVDGKLGWSTQPPSITTVTELSIMVRRVRNNLFHGSKGSAATERDRNLLEAGTASIREIVRRLPAVEQRFYPEG